MPDIDATLDLIDRMAWMRRMCLEESPPGPESDEEPWFELRDAMVAAFSTLSPPARDLLDRVSSVEERLVGCVRKFVAEHQPV